MAGTSIGMIETRGYTAAVSGVDAAMKAANVEFLGYAHTSPALITIKFLGDVASVKAAVQAATAAAAAVGEVVSQLVIPRPDRQLSGLLRSDSPAPSRPASSQEPETLPQPAPKENESAPTATKPETTTQRKRPATRKKRTTSRPVRTTRQTAAATPKAKPELPQEQPVKVVKSTPKKDADEENK